MKKKLKEDVPANNVSSGNIAGANPADPTNPPVKSKKSKKPLRVILRRKIP